MALEAVWQTLLCTRTKVILSLRSSPLVRAWLLAVSTAFFFLPDRLTFSGAFLVGVIDTYTLHPEHLFLVASYTVL